MMISGKPSSGIFMAIKLQIGSVSLFHLYFFCIIKMIVIFITVITRMIMLMLMRAGVIGSRRFGLPGFSRRLER